MWECGDWEDSLFAKVSDKLLRQSAKEVRSMLQSPRTMQRGHPWMDSSFAACSLVMPADQTLNFGQTIDILEAADRGLIWFIWSSTGTIYHCRDDGSKLGALGNPSIEPGVQLDNWMLYRSCWCLFSRKLAMYFKYFKYRVLNLNLVNVFFLQWS